jgi:hypothetical protein
MKDTRVMRNVIVWDRKTQSRVEIDLDVEVDIQWIAEQLAPKAYNNKSRKARALHGLVEVRMRGTKATPVNDNVMAAWKAPA